MDKILNDEEKLMCVLSERVIKKKHHVSYDTVLGMENAFAKNDQVMIKNLLVVPHKINAVLRRLGLKDNIICPFDIPSTNNVLFISMGWGGLNNKKYLLKQISSKRNLILYCFDIWEAEYDKWEALFDFIKPSYIFLAYQASVDYFSMKFSNVFFLPQSMDEKFFYPREIQKTRLFMQIGRKNQKIHEMILNYLAKNKISDTNENYVYERVARKIIFPDTNELAENICKSKYFVCAPQSDENSSLTGRCSDVTARFYEAMACKTLIIGFKPDTFDELFTQDSMVELKKDGSDFDDIIEYFESHPEEYKRIVEQNYKVLMEKHRWQNRYESILENI